MVYLMVLSGALNGMVISAWIEKDVGGHALIYDGT
jgi:hypothetical protein